MPTFKVVIGTKEGKSVQKDISEADANALLGKKIGDTINGESIGCNGYEFLITGGSDKCGFPMRKDVPGAGRKRILAVAGVGLKKKGKGIRQRKTVCGNTIEDKTVQVNMKVSKAGKDPLVKLEEPKEEKKE